MNTKRQKNSIWKLAVPEGTAPAEHLAAVVVPAIRKATEGYDEPMAPIEGMSQPFPGFQLSLHTGRRSNNAFFSFVREYFPDAEQHQDKFWNRNTDHCLFIATNSSLYAITTGIAYHAISGFADYEAPFDIARKLFANSFTSAEMRDMTGTTIKRTETYRRPYSIGKSDARNSVWRKLVGHLDPTRLPAESNLRRFINPAKPTTIEIASTFTMRHSMDLADVCGIIREIEALPEPTEEQRVALAFLDSLYAVQKDKDLRDALTGRLAEAIRLAILSTEDPPDIYVMDPAHTKSFDFGSEFQINGVSLKSGAPDLRDVLDAVRTKLKDHLTDSTDFGRRFTTLALTYRTDPDDPRSTVHPKLIDCLHGEIDHNGRIYFRLDKQWYGSSGDYLDNLKHDFLHEVFAQPDPILLPKSEITFLDWDGGSEHAFNRAQAKQPDFYLGDKIFAVTDRGQVELFDLLKVDHDKNKTYIIHTKKDFGAATREACSQIMMSADVISPDIRNGRKLLTRYYRDQWCKSELNHKVDENTFLRWFDYDLVFVVLCSTAQNFTAEDFTKNRLYSHIARRDILIARKHIGGSSFRLAHTRSTGKSDAR